MDGPNREDDPPSKVLNDASGGYITMNLTRGSFLRHKTAPAGTSLIGSFLNVLLSTRINA